MQKWFVVLCLDDRIADRPREYVMATRRRFPTRSAAKEYAKSVSPSRYAQVVQIEDELTVKEDGYAY